MKHTIKITIFTFFLLNTGSLFAQQPKWEYMLDLGAEQFKEKNYTEAVKSYTECIGDNNKADECFSGRGEAYTALGKETEAKSDYETAIKINPNNQPAIDALAKLKVAMSSKTKAIASTPPTSNQCVSGNCVNGKGKKVYDNGNTYEGDFVNSKLEGQGTFIATNGQIYIGQFANNQYNGRGKMTFPSGENYEGDWVNSVRNGKGTFTYKNGDNYAGEWKGDKINGYGKYYTKATNTAQEGNWKNGVFVQFSDVIIDVQILFGDRKYNTVLSAIDPLIAKYEANNKNDKDFAERLSNLYYMRGSSRFNVVYLARTGVVFNSEKVIDVTRARFEMVYNDKFIKLLDGAISDLDNAYEIGFANLYNGGSIYAEKFMYIEFNIREYEALTHLEKAQFITNSATDFSKVRLAFERLNGNYTVFHSPYIRFDDRPDVTTYKKSETLLAEMRYMVAMGQIDDALELYVKWNKFNASKKLSIAAMVEAFDMVGNYKYTEGFLVREAMRQISIDKGKIVPANLAIQKEAMKLHLYDYNYAVRILPTDKLLPLQRARLASAYMLKGNLTPAESAFVKNAPDVIKAEKETPPLDVLLNSIRLKLQSTDKKESNAAKKTIDELIIKDPTNVAILAVRGYSKMLAEDFKGAEIDLSAAITKEPFFAFVNGAFENRALVYKKLGKADLAAKDEKDDAQFKQLLGLLAAA